MRGSRYDGHQTWAARAASRSRSGVLRCPSSLPFRPCLAQIMTDSTKADNKVLLAELRREIARLEDERRHAEQRRDELMMVVEEGDDSGFTLSMALRDLKLVEKRLEQIRGLAAGVEQRLDN